MDRINVVDILAAIDDQVERHNAVTTLCRLQHLRIRTRSSVGNVVPNRIIASYATNGRILCRTERQVDS